jgi:hypothetical protein
VNYAYKKGHVKLPLWTTEFMRQGTGMTFSHVETLRFRTLCFLWQANFSPILSSEDEKVAARDEKIAVMDEKVAARDEKVAVMDEKVVPGDEKIAARDEKVVSGDEKVAAGDEKIVPGDENLVPTDL